MNIFSFNFNKFEKKWFWKTNTCQINTSERTRIKRGVFFPAHDAARDASKYGIYRKFSYAEHRNGKFVLKKRTWQSYKTKNIQWYLKLMLVTKNDSHSLCVKFCMRYCPLGNLGRLAIMWRCMKFSWSLWQYEHWESWMAWFYPAPSIH